MRRNNWLALLLALVMVLTMVPTAAAAAYISEEDVSLGAYGTEPDVFVAPAVQANSSAVSVLQVSGRWPAATKTVSSTGDFPLTLRDGDIVELKGDLTVDFRAKTGQSPIAVAANAKAALIISGDVKLYGANASGTTGAAAAIHVPSSSALTIYSGNDKDWADPDHSGETLRLYSLAAYGGSAAQGGAGGKAKENVETTEYSNNVWESVYTWSTGGGGNGGGGSGGSGGHFSSDMTNNVQGCGGGGADNHDSPAYNGGAGGAGGGRVSLTRWNTAGALIFSTANKLALTRSNMSIAFGDGSGYYAAGQEPADNRPNVIYDLRDCTVEFNETTYPGADGKATTSVKSISLPDSICAEAD